jgi:hypothetical protein
MTVSESDPYVKKLMGFTGQGLFNELLSSRQRAKVIYVIMLKAHNVNLDPDKWMALELQREIINKISKFKNQDDLYDLVNLREPTRIK